MDPLPPDLEYGIALRLLSQAPRLDLAILEDLMGKPKRYSDLQRVFQERSDSVLARAMRRLQDEGVIQSGVDRDMEQTAYALTTLGKLVIFRVHEMVPHRQSIEAYERGLRRHGLTRTPR